MTYYKDKRMSKGARIYKWVLGRVVTVAIVYAIIDMVMFFAWAMSEQVPPFGWYWGQITTEIIRLFI